MTRALSNIKYGEKASKKEIQEAMSKGLDKWRAEYLSNIWFGIVRESIDRYVGEDAKVVSFGWFQETNLTKEDELSKFVQDVKGIPFEVDGKIKYKYKGHYFTPEGNYVSYCNAKDIDDGDQYVEITYEIFTDGKPERGTIVINRGGGRVEEFEE